MADREIVLRTVNLSRVVLGKRLVDDISIQVEKGEVLAIAGPSCAGKSSFLRLLNRLDEPPAGAVLLQGQDYRAIPPRNFSCARRPRRRPSRADLSTRVGVL